MKKIILPVFIIVLTFLISAGFIGAQGVLSPTVAPTAIRVSPTSTNTAIVNFSRTLKTDTNYLPWRSSTSRITTGATGASFTSLIKTFSAFGLVDPSIARTATTFGPTTGSVVDRLTQLFGIQGDGASVFGPTTSAAFGKFIDRLNTAVADPSLPPGLTGFYAVYPGDYVASFNAEKNAFNAPTSAPSVYRVATSPDSASRTTNLFTVLTGKNLPVTQANYNLNVTVVSASGTATVINTSTASTVPSTGSVLNPSINCTNSGGAGCISSVASGDTVALMSSYLPTGSWVVTGATAVSGCTTGYSCVFTMPNNNVQVTVTMPNSSGGGGIVVKKVTLDVNGNQFGDPQDFKLDLTGPNNYTATKTLDTDAYTNTTYSYLDSIVGVPAGGPYTLKENPVNGWFLKDITCISTSNFPTPFTYSLTSGTVTFNMPVAGFNDIPPYPPNNSINCTFTNQMVSATITISKTIKGGTIYPGPAFPFTGTAPIGNFSLDVDVGTATPDTKIFTVPPGNYTITENLPSGWYLNPTFLITCIQNINSGSTQVIGTSVVITNLQGGGALSCTYTNTSAPPPLALCGTNISNLFSIAPMPPVATAPPYGYLFSGTKNSVNIMVGSNVVYNGSIPAGNSYKAELIWQPNPTSTATPPPTAWQSFTAPSTSKTYTSATANGTSLLTITTPNTYAPLNNVFTGVRLTPYTNNLAGTSCLLGASNLQTLGLP